MQTNYIKAAIVTVWIAALATYAFAVELTSLGGWAFLVGVGAIPPAVMLRLWNPPARTMSQDIQEALNPAPFSKGRAARP